MPIPQTQQTIQFNGGVHKVVISQFERVPEESKNDELKTKVEPTVAGNIKSFCRGRKITVADFLREYARLGDLYYDHVDALLSNADVLVPMLERLPKKI